MLRTMLSLVVVLVLAPVISFFTAYVVVGHDPSQADTVGDIRLQGFPIWFQESAPGYSVAAGWHPERFWSNTALWALVLVVIVLILISARLLTQQG
jgi:hypothetical protein